jgi:hypothetical protein
MSRAARYGTLATAMTVMALVGLTVLGSGVIARAAGPETPAMAPGDISPDAQAKPPHGYRGFCRCSCTLVPHCNTDADCGGGICSRAITCC